MRRLLKLPLSPAEFERRGVLPNSSIPHTIGVARPGIDLKLELGGTIPREALHIEYSTWGDPTMPTIFLFPSMSNNCFPIPSPLVPLTEAPGWWNRVMGVGSEFGLDLNKFHVVVGAVLGAPFGSTSPLSLNPSTGKKYGSEFPKITPADMAKAQSLLLDCLGIDRVDCVVGGSMGGMQSIQFACQFPDRYDKLISIASTAHTSPATVAIRSMQRVAVRADPNFATEHYPTSGLRIARMIGTVAYRSRLEFDSRFNWLPRKTTGKFEVEEYLEKQADKFTEMVSYDADCYLLLSEAMDRMNIGVNGGFELGASRIPTDKQVMLLSYSTDVLTPPQDLERLASVLGQRGVPVYYESINSLLGHDSFLAPGEAQPLVFRMREFLECCDLLGSVHRVRRLVQEMHG